MKPLYINGVGCISPQLPFEDSFLAEVKEYNTNKMLCAEPDYSKFLDPTGLRRMSRIMKFSNTAALMALKDADIKTPSGITTGTGFGLLENSEKFLKSMIEQNESTLSPTSFIQSTHNTVGGNIALLTGCTAHNNTFSQKGFSFESALTDARLMIAEGADNFLLGAYDELTEYSYAIMARLNILRKEPCNNLQLFREDIGVIVGEGAAFFVLAKEKVENSYGRVIDNHSFQKPLNTSSAKEQVNSFLKRNNLQLNDIDVVISGLCGDTSRDEIPAELNRTLFAAQTIVVYKHLCGEYMTASSFAFWLAAKMMKTQVVPVATILENRDRKPKNILLYNSYKDNHSLILFQAC